MQSVLIIALFMESFADSNTLHARNFTLFRNDLIILLLFELIELNEFNRISNKIRENPLN